MSNPPPTVPIPASAEASRRFDLSHAVALITGGGSGIGRAIARAFAACGARVAITGRRQDKLQETADLIEQAEGECLCLTGDVREETDIALWMDAMRETYGGFTCLVNNAGVIGNGAIDGTDPAEWDRIMDTNVRGVFLVSRAAVAVLKQVDPGKAPSIINVGSVTGTRPYAGVLAYCTSKAAVQMMTQCMAQDLAPHGIRVNGLNPGTVRSELHTVGGAIPDYEAWLEHSSKVTHPLGRHGEPEDVAWAACFLASREAAWLTGDHIAIDGGRALTGLR